MKLSFSQNFKDSLLYSSGNYIFRFSSVITNIIINRILGPTMAGAISYINAIDQNVDLLYSPIRAALERELPKLRKTNIPESIIFAETAFLFSYILIFFGSLIYSLIYILNDNEYVKYAALFFIGVNIVKALSSLLRIYHKSLLHFKAISITLFIVAIIQPFIIIFLVKSYNYHGFFIGRIIIFLITTVLLLMFLKYYPKFKLSLEFEILKKIYILGFPLVLSSIISILLITIDKFFIKTYLDLNALGLYSIGAMLFQVLLLFPDSIYGSYYPKFLVKDGDQNERIELLTQIVKVGSLVIIAILWVFIHPMLELILPQFTDGEKSIKILFFAFYFASTFQMYYYELIRRKKVMKVNYYSVFILFIAAPLFWIVTNKGYGIEGVAYVTVFSFALLSSIRIIIAQNEMKLGAKNIIKTLFSNLLYAIPIIPMLLLDYYYEYSLISEVLKILLFILFFSPFLYKLLKNKKLYKVIFSK